MAELLNLIWQALKLKADSSIKNDKGTPVAESGERSEKRVPMTRLRKRVAERLLSATQETAMLTTFNEVNMKPLMDMRLSTKISLRSVMVCV